MSVVTFVVTNDASDVIEDIPHSGAMEAHAQVRDSLVGMPEKGKSSSKRHMASLFKDFGQRVAKMDKEGAPRVIDSLKSYLDNYDSQKNPLATIEEYTEFRRLNVGFGFVFASFFDAICPVL